MVAVRKSHQMTQANFAQWLETLEINQSKSDALQSTWHALKPLFEQEPQCQLKALEMVEILAALNLDKESLIAAMLSPLVEYQLISRDQVVEDYPKSIHTLVASVIQMDAIKSLQQGSNSQVAVNQIDNIRKMLLAMVEDVRAVVIKLAERLCHLRMVKDSDEETRVLAAKETTNIYAPLANRLGIGQLKWELEDIAFRYLHPDTYKTIAKLLDEKRLDRERYMTDFVANLQQQLDDTGVTGEVYGRPKHIYSIWKKMQKKSLDFDQLYDVRAVRVIVDKLQDCYSALGIVHTSWNHLPNEFDDYVATPKANGYQSIHTVVLGPEGKSVEVQIRTDQMHQDAELGVAAHWRYKEGMASGKSSSGFDEKINWLRKILQWQEDVSESGELIDELRSQVFEDRIYVFTPSGDVIDLPQGATPLDFAYYIHSNVGHCCIGAKVFGRIVPFTHKLETGDQVEVLTSKTPNPSRDWLNPNLNYIHTARARAKVQHFFKLLDRDKHIALGKEQLEQELSRLDLSGSDLTPAIGRFNVKTLDDLYAAIGSGNARLQQVANFLLQLKEKSQPKQDIDPSDLVRQQSAQRLKSDANGVTVSGVGNLMTHMAKCCQPVPGDAIQGFITQGRGISVHRADCDQLANSLKQQPERSVDVQWGLQERQNYQARIQMLGTDRQGLLRDISTIIANERVSIVGIESSTNPQNQSMKMIINVEVSNSEALDRLRSKLMQLDDVAEVKRL
ncbi:GTP diphosphokinase [Thalassotalea agarivorans]|uniref:GTP pyrophosphokinase n=1 Tax=Thalassotalea agarivorans TaxID=349064 RepID=A0A1I0FWP9_THASX|nr:GTP diphosphokinase [Thalassotalea agarivorans]SET62696.1 (p)ppGpp synthetase I, SpoT/RelA [Thalassotalea agarivorans]